MSNLGIWTFSQSSEQYLQRCIAAAPPPDPNNKWYQKFRLKTTPPESVTIKDEYASEENDIPKVNNDETISYEDFFDTIMSESIIPLEYVLQSCTKNPALVTKMAEKLSSNSVEQLFKDIFSRNDVETEFLHFITSFLSHFVKLHNSRLCIDLLIESSKYSRLFKQLLEIMLNDSEMPNLVLNNYIAASKEASATDFMRTISRIDITSTGFTQNVSLIYNAYKDCIKDEFIQNCVKNMIIQHSNVCTTQRHFGRLVLLFLQTEKVQRTTVDIKILKECLEVHSSPFKRPCLNLLTEMSCDDK